MNEMEQLAEFAYNIWRIAQYKLCRHDGHTSRLESYVEDELDVVKKGNISHFITHLTAMRRYNYTRSMCFNIIGKNYIVAGIICGKNEPDDDNEDDFEYQRRGYSKEFFRKLASETVNWEGKNQL